MSEKIEPSQELAEVQEVTTAENSTSEEIQVPSEVPRTKEDGPHEEMDSSKPQTSPKPSIEIIENNNPVEGSTDKLSSTEQDRIGVSEEGKISRNNNSCKSIFKIVCTVQ